MNKNISNIKTVSEYNDLLGVETLHPLVSVIDLSKVDPINNMRLIFDFYVVFLKEDKTAICFMDVNVTTIRKVRLSASHPVRS